MTHRTISIRGPVSMLVAAAFLAVLGACAQTSTETGEFVILLGTDTTAVESYTRTPDGFHATAIVRTPRTMVHDLDITFAEDGTLERVVATERDPAEGADAAPVQRTVVEFDGDSATQTVERADGETSTNVVAAGPDMLPRMLTFYSLQELLVERARASDADTVYMLGDGPVPIAVRRPTSDSVAFVTPDFGVWRAHVDERGRMQTLDAGMFGRLVTRVEDLDVDATAEIWAAQDAAGGGMGPLSPRDTTSATVGDATLTFDYGRPSKRGREVFGGMIEYGEVWRLGANLATHFTTDRPLVIGDVSVPAGTYTLFAVPNPDEWALIVSSETGQWGTEYDPERDLARIPMAVTSPDEVVETLTISVEPAGGGSELALAWDRTRAAVPVSVASGT